MSLPGQYNEQLFRQVVEAQRATIVESGILLKADVRALTAAIAALRNLDMVGTGDGYARLRGRLEEARQLIQRHGLLVCALELRSRLKAAEILGVVSPRKILESVYRDASLDKIRLLLEEAESAQLRLVSSARMNTGTTLQDRNTEVTNVLADLGDELSRQSDCLRIALREHPKLPDFVHTVKWSSLEGSPAYFDYALDAFRIAGLALAATPAGAAFKASYVVANEVSSTSTGKGLLTALYERTKDVMGLNVNPKAALVSYLAGECIMQLLKDRKRVQAAGQKSEVGSAAVAATG